VVRVVWEAPAAQVEMVVMVGTATTALRRDSLVAALVARVASVAKEVPGAKVAMAAPGVWAPEEAYSSRAAPSRWSPPLSNPTTPSVEREVLVASVVTEVTEVRVVTVVAEATRFMWADPAAQPADPAEMVGTGAPAEMPQPAARAAKAELARSARAAVCISEVGRSPSPETP
jgi:hypothetical protein